MITTLDKTTPYRKNQKVIATTDLPGVPEGTRGKVKVINGMTWLRYWVMFDNGAWLGQVDHAQLVPAGEWAEYQRRREEAANAPAEADGDADSGAGDGDGPAAAAGEGATVNGVSVPAHLLDRSKKARERLGA